MKLGELMSLMSCKNGDELCLKVIDILHKFGISATDEYGDFKDLHTLCCDVAEVLNKEK